MPPGTIEDAGLEAEIGRLPTLSLLELRNRWKTLFGHPAPKSLRRNFLARAVAYQMQVDAYGGLSVATKRRLREIANAVRNGDANEKSESCGHPIGCRCHEFGEGPPPCAGVSVNHHARRLSECR
jgi:hypothetical protein